MLQKYIYVCKNLSSFSPMETLHNEIAIATCPIVPAFQFDQQDNEIVKQR